MIRLIFLFLPYVLIPLWISFIGSKIRMNAKLGYIISSILLIAYPIVLYSGIYSHNDEPSVEGWSAGLIAVIVSFHIVILTPLSLYLQSVFNKRLNK